MKSLFFFHAMNYHNELTRFLVSGCLEMTQTCPVVTMLLFNSYRQVTLIITKALSCLEICQCTNTGQRSCIHNTASIM